MTFSVENFKGKFDGGARANLFRVEIYGFEGIETEKTSYLAKAATLPGSTVASIEVPFRGRVVKVAGDRTFEDWTVTFINNNDFAVRSSFEVWMNNYLNSHGSNIGESNPATYKRDMAVHQLNKNEEIIASYQIIGAFPTTIDAIDVSFENTGAVEEFGVTFSYDYWIRLDTGVV